MSKRNILVGKTKYDGPKTFPAILKQIQKDLGSAVSLDFVKQVVYLFYSERGLGEMLKNNDLFRLSGIGNFYLQFYQKRKREKEKIKKHKRFRWVTNRAKDRFVARQRILAKLKRINDYRASNGKEPIHLKEYLSYKYPNTDIKKYNFKL